MALIPDLVVYCLKALEAIVEHAQCQDHLENNQYPAKVWQDELGSLRLWSANLGAHLRGRKSLIYRLRDDSKIEGQIVSLLTSLKEALDMISANLAPVAVTSDDSSEEEAQDDQSIWYNVIVRTIRRLYRMSMLVQKPHQSDFLRTGNIKKAMLALPLELDRIRSKYPYADDAFRQHLARAMVQRRNYLEYRYRHSASTKQSLCESLTADSDSEHSGTNASETTEYQNMDIVATTMGFSDTSFATSFVKGTHPNFPRRPRSSARGAAFECPFCYYIITAANSRSWVKHVFSDLKPYMCHIPDCATSDELYDSWHVWFEHVRAFHPSEHRQECPFCLLMFEENSHDRGWAKHVGKHFQDLAVFALRPLDEEGIPFEEDNQPTSDEQSSDPDDYDHSRVVYNPPAQKYDYVYPWNREYKVSINADKLRLGMIQRGTDWEALGQEVRRPAEWVRHWYCREIRKGQYGAALDLATELANQRLGRPPEIFTECKWTFPCLVDQCIAEFEDLSRLQTHMDEGHAIISSRVHSDFLDETTGKICNLYQPRYGNTDAGIKVPESTTAKRWLQTPPPIDWMMSIPSQPNSRGPPFVAPPPPPPEARGKNGERLEDSPFDPTILVTQAGWHEVSNGSSSASNNGSRSAQHKTLIPPHLPSNIPLDCRNLPIYWGIPTHLETADSIAHRFDLVYVPKAQRHIDNPPVDLKARYDEYKFLYEDCLKRLVTKLELLGQLPENSLEELRKETLVRVKALMVDLDRVGTTKDSAIHDLAPELALLPPSSVVGEASEGSQGPFIDDVKDLSLNKRTEVFEPHEASPETTRAFQEFLSANATTKKRRDTLRWILNTDAEG